MWESCESPSKFLTFFEFWIFRELVGEFIILSLELEEAFKNFIQNEDLKMED